ncbi:curli assembly chaperone CsgC [Citrobacter rodentium]|uniref:Curli assembly protein n=2 Tax=Citrobacter rodentium TaxID=67825 RepID=D2TT50_CITRI|nr:curli assembly chaperone CsgC [Citrobacter rodentium]KIQ49525.1 Curli assembly protein CsgC [Citrobacter rodentium]UHO30377.1 curli assembly protein CsgC [Citrobacter rodentium NBRC 105723 = DSM 16636]CBG87874.1 putative curli production protein csgc precursor [Citrobacter rodentium ICC168]HAT8014774.1 curli assembly protein CsgC [Citrobacter rodentium NBRC 105723 = DSM 16636]HAT8019773.1 curli assembly protein CsgC [Citrobacter rodentium]
MNSFILVAALSSQIAFSTTQQGDVYTIIPQVTLAQPCVCQVQILALREGVAGQSRSQQKKTLSLPANQPIDLTKLSLTISPQDNVKIIVTVSDGQAMHLSQQWPPPATSS